MNALPYRTCATGWTRAQNERNRLSKRERENGVAFRALRGRKAGRAHRSAGARLLSIIRVENAVVSASFVVSSKFYCSSMPFRPIIVAERRLAIIAPIGVSRPSPVRADTLFRIVRRNSTHGISAAIEAIIADRSLRNDDRPQLDDDRFARENVEVGPRGALPNRFASFLAVLCNKIVLKISPGDSSNYRRSKYRCPTIFR